MRLRRREGGQALVEMALILPVLIILTMLALDFGQALYNYIDLTNAAREGAMYASAHPTDTSGIQSAVSNELSGSLPGRSLSIATTGAGTPGSMITVSVRSAFPLTTAELFGVTSVTLNTQASAVVQ